MAFTKEQLEEAKEAKEQWYKNNEVNEDNWKHRANNMLCQTCMFFVPKTHHSLGRCRRNAPTMAGFPAVFETDWCGNHKIDENKLN